LHQRRGRHFLLFGQRRGAAVVQHAHRRAGGGSHRQVDRSQSQLTADGRIYRPWRPHQERALVTPGEVTDYLVDVFPVGHVFLPGHELVVKVHAPPAEDNDYAYVQKTLPGVPR